MLAVAVLLRGAIAAVHIEGIALHSRHLGRGPAVLHDGILANPAGKLAVVGRSVYLARRVAVPHHRDGTCRRAVGMDAARIDSKVGDGAFVTEVEQVDGIMRARESAHNSCRVTCS